MNRNTKDRKVSAQEIEQLHIFVQKHYVEFYDVELELVDHLANDIEQQWREEVQLSFEEVLNRAFKKFGIYGFSDVVERKIYQLQMSYFKMMLKEVGTFFTLPKIMFSVALYLVLFAIGYTFQEVGIGSLYCLLFILIAVYSVTGVLWQRKLKKRQKIVNKKFLLEDLARQIYAGGGVFSIVSIFIQLPNLKTFTINLPFAAGMIALLLLVIILWFYVAVFVIKPQLHAQILQLPQKYQMN